MRLFILLLLGSIVACERSLPQKTTPKNSSLTTTTQKTVYPEGMPPVYDQFDDLAFLFNQQSDTTYLINFWATWCKPCVKELPYFEALRQQYSQTPFKIVLVSLDFKKQLTTKLLPFIEEHALQSEIVVLIDPNENVWVDKIEPEWSGAIPMTLLYRKDKHVFQEGSFESLKELEDWVQVFLNYHVQRIIEDNGFRR